MKTTKLCKKSSTLSPHLFGPPSLRNFPKSSTLLVHLGLLAYFEPESRPAWSLQLDQHNDARAHFLLAIKQHIDLLKSGNIKIMYLIINNHASLTHLVTPVGFPR